MCVHSVDALLKQTLLDHLDQWLKVPQNPSVTVDLDGYSITYSINQDRQWTWVVQRSMNPSVNTLHLQYDRDMELSDLQLSSSEWFNGNYFNVTGDF